MTNNSDGTSTPFNEVNLEAAIEQYATAYGRLDEIQKSQKDFNGKDGKHKLIPVGDQKTGAIGEYYALKYLSEHLKGSDDTVFIGENPSQAAGTSCIAKPSSNAATNLTSAVLRRAIDTASKQFLSTQRELFPSLNRAIGAF